MSVVLNNNNSIVLVKFSVDSLYMGHEWERELQGLEPNVYIPSSKAWNLITQEDGNSWVEDSPWSDEDYFIKERFVMWHSLMPLREAMEKMYYYGGVPCIDHHLQNLIDFWGTTPEEVNEIAEDIWSSDSYHVGGGPRHQRRERKEEAA